MKIINDIVEVMFVISIFIIGTILVVGWWNYYQQYHNNNEVVDSYDNIIIYVCNETFTYQSMLITEDYKIKQVIWNKTLSQNIVIQQTPCENLNATTVYNDKGKPFMAHAHILTSTEIEHYTLPHIQEVRR